MVLEWMVLQTWQTFLHGKCMSYNPTVVSCLHWQGGTFSPMTCLIFWKLLWWCHLHNTTLQVQHIVRKLMVITDSLSRIGQIIYSNGLSIQQSFSMCAKLFVLVFFFSFGCWWTTLPFTSMSSRPSCPQFQTCQHEHKHYFIMLCLTLMFHFFLVVMRFKGCFIKVHLNLSYA